VNKTLKAALAAALVVSTTQIARADLTQDGAVGLPLNPTAQIPMEGGVRIQANYYDFGDLSIAPAGRIGDFKRYGVYASGRVWKNLEINGGIEKLKASENTAVVPAGALNPLDKTGLALGAKYLITRESEPAGVRFAVGTGYSRAMLKNWHVYGVATKSFGEINTEGRNPITAHLGLRYDRFQIDNLIPGAKDSTRVSIYGGVEVPVSTSISVVGELQSKNQEFGNNLGVAWQAKIPYSASIRYRPQGQGFSGSVGIARQGLTGDNGLFLQLGYSFDTGTGAGGGD
jgi:hypothetical protein